MIQQLRKHPRFKLEVPVIFFWREPNGSRRRARGYTRDLSPGGMFLITPRTPPLGTTIGLDAYLPPLSEAAGNWRIVSKGRVVRVEANPKVGVPGGFAAVSQRFVLRAVNGAN